MAAPVVGRILSEVLPYLDIQPVYSEEEKETLDIAVPKLTGKTIEEATLILEKEGLTVRITGDGETITDQLPSANITVAPNSQVILYAGGEKPNNIGNGSRAIWKELSGSKKSVGECGSIY